MNAHFDKPTSDWFKKNPFSETTVMQCDKCGLYYKPSLNHICSNKLVKKGAGNGVKPSM